MKISLYNTTSEQNRLVKDLSLIKEVENAKVVNIADTLNLQVVLKRDIVDDFTKINYIYVDSFKRYYFSKVSVENGFIILDCLVDVLMSYADSIKNLTATIDRNEFLKNGYLQDNSYKVMAYEEIVCKSFPNGLTNDSLILMTVG